MWDKFINKKKFIIIFIEVKKMKNKAENKDKFIKLRVTETQKQKIDNESKRKGITVSELVREAIEDYLNKGD